MGGYKRSRRVVAAILRDVKLCVYHGDLYVLSVIT